MSIKIRQKKLAENHQNPLISDHQVIAPTQFTAYLSFHLKHFKSFINVAIFQPNFYLIPHNFFTPHHKQHAHTFLMTISLPLCRSQKQLCSWHKFCLTIKTIPVPFFSVHVIQCMEWYKIFSIIKTCKFINFYPRTVKKRSPNFLLLS